MKVVDHLSDEKKRQLRTTPKKKCRNKEKLSTNDIKELMGMNRQTYYKKNGAWHGK